MRYYLVFCDLYPNGIIVNIKQIRQCKLKSYDVAIEVDSAMLSLTKYALLSIAAD